VAYIGQKPADKPLGASDITDGIISNAKLAQDIISAETELAEAPASTDEFLISDAGVLKRLDASHVGSTATAEFSAYISSDQTINDATNTALVFQTELFDPDSVYNTSNGRFTAPSDGIYFLSANYWTYDAQSNIQGQNINFYVNGSAKYRQEFVSEGLRFQKFDSQLNAVISLSANDYVQVYAYADTNDSGSFAVESSSGIYQNIFSGFRLPT